MYRPPNHSWERRDPRETVQRRVINPRRLTRSLWVINATLSVAMLGFHVVDVNLSTERSQLAGCEKTLRGDADNTGRVPSASVFCDPAGIAVNDPLPVMQRKAINLEAIIAGTIFAIDEPHAVTAAQTIGEAVSEQLDATSRTHAMR